MQGQKQANLPIHPGALGIGSTVPVHGPPADVAQLAAVLTDMRFTLEEIRATLAKKSKDFYTVEEIANFAGRSMYTIRRWISEGRITATRVQGTGPRGRLLIAHEQIGKLIQAGNGANI